MLFFFFYFHQIFEPGVLLWLNELPRPQPKKGKGAWLVRVRCKLGTLYNVEHCTEIA